MGSAIKDVMSWGLGVFFHIFKISSVSIYLCLGLGYLWFYFVTAVCPVIWNKFGVSSAFCTDIGTWVLRFERSFVLQRYAFRCIAKQGRRSLHRIMGRWLWLNGMGCHQVWSVVSSNHRQIQYSPCKSDFGRVESGVIYMVTLWLTKWFYRKGGPIWYFLLATLCTARFNINGGRRGCSNWSIIRLGRRLICIFIKFKYAVLLHSTGIREVNVRLSVIGSRLEGSTMESDGYLAGKIIFLNGIRGKINYDCMVIMRCGRQELVWGYTTMMVTGILEGVLWLISKILWWLRFQGIFKPKLRSSREPISRLYNEST